MSPNEKKIEQILTTYFLQVMPEAIQQLPDGQSFQPGLQSVAIQQPASRKRSLSVVAGLVTASCALLMVFFAVNIPVSPENNSSVPAGDVVQSKDDIGTIIPVDDSFKKKPVEMQGVNPQNWVKKIHIDPKTGLKTERLEPKFDLNTKPHHQIKMVLPLDDDDDEFENGN